MKGIFQFHFRHQVTAPFVLPYMEAMSMLGLKWKPSKFLSTPRPLLQLTPNEHLGP